MRHIVGIADMKISADKSDLIVTHALGSCLGLTIYDPVACVGGMLHVMLPVSSIAPDKAAANPCMFVDTGVPKLFLDGYKAGAKKHLLEVKVAGGGSQHQGEDGDHFQIGKRNFTSLRKILWRNGVLLKSYDVGGNNSRTMSLDVGTGQVIVKVDGREKIL